MEECKTFKDYIEEEYDKFVEELTEDIGEDNVDGEIERLSGSKINKLSVEDKYKLLKISEYRLYEIFMDAMCDGDELSFYEKFISDMAYHAVDRDYPTGFFNDLQYGGCQSGMIGMLIYNSDCKDIYIQNIDDMESFKEELEDDIGGKIANRHELPHYTFVCWLCYEELARRIVMRLFPDEF